MITKITGTVDDFSGNILQVALGGLAYEIYIPTAVIKSLEGRLEKNSQISLTLYHYLQTDPSKSIPVLIGFSSRIEKEFFEKFITVSGVGPKAAVKALSMPIPEIAAAIDAGDINYLKSLPGIGMQRAKEIVAKLQGKMGKFGLMRSPEAAGRVVSGSDGGTVHGVKDEAIEVLLQLQYKREEAMRMLERAFSRKPGLASVEEILNEVYRQKKEVPA